MIITQQDVNLQRRLLHDSFLHPHSPWRLNHGTCCWRRVTPAGGAVPTTVMVTAPIAEADGSAPIAEADGSAPVAEANGSIPTSSHSGSGEADGLQMDTVSVQQYRYLMIQQGSIFITGRLNFLCFPFAHNPTTLQDQRQSFGQLHGWSRGVVPSRLPLGFPLHQGAPAFSGLAAGQSLGYPSPLRFGCGAGEKLVRSRDVGLWTVALVQFCVSLQKVSS
jgi:hypothetical protein